MKRGYNILGGTIAILAIVFFVWGAINYETLQGEISQQIEIYGLIALVVLSFFLDLFPQYISPHIGLFSAALFNFNLINSFFLVLIGSTVGSIVGFEIGKAIRSKSSKNLFGKTFQIKRAINQKGKWVVSLAAVSPVPYLPIVLGILDMKRDNFIIYGIVPRAIGLFLITLFAYGVI